MQLLSPAGNMESLIAAVQNGANAVYFGGQSFNARRSAANFTDEQLREAMDYCHQRGVQAFITLNILLHDDELPQAVAFAERMAHIGADALIVQDLGLIALLKDCTDLPLHASTQMALHNLEGIRQAEKLGLSRIVLSREVSLADVSHIKENSKVKLELFAHGALCVGFSGQCYFSSLTGGRSGNRGVCAQICRLPMSLYQGQKRLMSGYSLSPKDLCTVQVLAALKEAGADCLKIEGRMKRPEYVAGVTRIYREAIDLLEEQGKPDAQGKFPDDRATEELAKLFNRGGFTKGYYFNEKKIIYPYLPSHLGVKVARVPDGGSNRAELLLSASIGLQDGVEFRQEMHPLSGGLIEWIEKNGERVPSAQAGEKVTINCKGTVPAGAMLFKLTDQAQMKQYAPTGKEMRTLPVSAQLELKEQAAKLRFVYKNAIIAEAEQDVCITYDQSPTSDEDMHTAIGKLGGTVFSLQKLDIIRSGHERIAAKTLNQLRRTAAEELAQRVLKENTPSWRFEQPKQPKVQKRTQKQPPLIAVEVRSIQGVREALTAGADTVYFRPELYTKSTFDGLNTLPKSGKLYVAVPNIALKEDMLLLRSLLTAYSHLYEGILAGNLSGVELAQELQKPWIGDFTLNVFNLTAAQYMMSLPGAERITLSVELNAEQLQEITPYVSSETVVYGRLPLMFLAHCPVYNALSEDSGDPCSKCSDGYYYKDRRDILFPLGRTKVNKCYHTVYNSRILSLFEQGMIERITPAAIRLIPEGDIGECIAAFKAGTTPVNIELFTGTQTTKGHYARGAE